MWKRVGWRIWLFFAVFWCFDLRFYGLNVVLVGVGVDG